MTERDPQVSYYNQATHTPEEQRMHELEIVGEATATLMEELVTPYDVDPKVDVYTEFYTSYMHVTTQAAERVGSIDVSPSTPNDTWFSLSVQNRTKSGPGYTFRATQSGVEVLKYGVDGWIKTPLSVKGLAHAVRTFAARMPGDWQKDVLAGLADAEVRLAQTTSPSAEN